MFLKGFFLKYIFFLFCFFSSISAINVDFEDLTFRDFIDVYSDVSRKYFIYPPQFDNKKIFSNIPFDVNLTSSDLGLLLDDFLLLNLLEKTQKGKYFLIHPIVPPLPPKPPKKFDFFYLSRNRPVLELKSLLTSLSGTKKSNINIKIDNETNNLIFHCSKKEYKSIKKRLIKLDKPKKQLYIKLKIFEVSKGNSEKFGFEHIDSLSFAIGASTPIAFLSSELANTILNSDDVQKVNRKLNFASTFNFLNSVDVSKSLSEPVIFTTQNVQNSFFVGLEQSVQTTTTQNVQKTESFERKKFGLNFTFKANILNENNIQINLKISSSDILNTNGYNPIVSDKTLNTTIIIPDNDTVMIGGLRQVKTSKSNSKIPYFSDLPYIGWFFKNESEVFSDSKLFILIEAKIIDDVNEISKVQENFIQKWSKLYTPKNFKFELD